MAVRRQRGPSATVGNTPNMLAPLLGGTSELSTSYPPMVLTYLHSIPAGEAPERGTCFEQLISQWTTAGLWHSDTLPNNTALVASRNPNVKVSIDDLTNRVKMLGDIQGRVSLMKRDLAVLVHSFSDLTKE